MRVLVVDDDPSTTQSYAEMLRSDGYEVETAIDGAIGSYVAMTGVFDLVIADLAMPRVDGVKLLQRVRNGPFSHDTPVAIVTGQDAIDEKTLAELDRLGAVVRHKPLWSQDLDQIARTLVHSSED